MVKLATIRYYLPPPSSPFFPSPNRSPILLLPIILFSPNTPSTPLPILPYVYNNSKPKELIFLVYFKSSYVTKSIYFTPPSLCSPPPSSFPPPPLSLLCPGEGGTVGKHVVLLTLRANFLNRELVFQALCLFLQA